MLSDPEDVHYMHFLKPDYYKDSICGAKWSSGSGVVGMVNCPDCLKLIKDGANTRHSEPYKFGEKDLYVGSIDDPTKEWPESVNFGHDGTYDLEEGIELISDEFIKQGNCSEATIMSLRENCKRLLSRVKELESNE